MDSRQQTVARTAQTSTPIRSGVLQRACACGQHTHGEGECAECRKKRAGSSQIDRATYQAEQIAPSRSGPAWDFSRVQSMAEAGAPSQGWPAVAKWAWLFDREAGTTGCDVSVGTPSTTIYEQSPCKRPCVERHEAVHRKDIAPCCKSANGAYNRAKSDSDRGAVQDRFNTWLKANENFLECRGYAESARCGTEYRDKNCDLPKTTDAGAPEAASADTIEPTSSFDVGLSQDDLEPAVRAEADTGTPGTAPSENKPPQPTPEQCCTTMKNYARISGARRDNVCEQAKKTLESCPF